MRAIIAIPLLVILVALQVPAQDRDGDGLEDFQEIHKYRTDPDNPDSDGDGTPDGDWDERREFQYTVRRRVVVMKPVTPATLNDDYQDARVLAEGDDWVELEVVHYPFNDVADSLQPDPNWRTAAKRMNRWLKPGVTADWTPRFATRLIADLKTAGIDAEKLDDVSLCREATAWLLERAKVNALFSTFITSFDEMGRPYVIDELKARAAKGIAETSFRLEEAWQRELFARGMYEHETRGSCSSSAIYLAGCLKALGIPTRIILCIPAYDASDPAELDLVRNGITNTRVRDTIIAAQTGLETTWSSHTMNEVFVGGRWRRLNYRELDQGILDRRFLGLMTKVAVFDDWADARMPETIGIRQLEDRRPDRFGGRNPYSTMAIDDAVGPHCKVEVPSEPPVLGRIKDVIWTDDESLDEGMRRALAGRGRFGLLVRIEGVPDLKSFLVDIDLRLYLEAEGAESIAVGFDPGCWWNRTDHGLVFIPLTPADQRDLERGRSYRLRARNARNAPGRRLMVAEGLSIPPR